MNRRLFPIDEIKEGPMSRKKAAQLLSEAADSLEEGKLKEALKLAIKVLNGPV